MNYISYLLSHLKKQRIQILLILLCTIFAYSSIFGNGFAWDDKDTILQWEAKTEWSSIPRFILGETPPTHLGNYRPFRNILYIVTHKIWGTHPFGYHLQTIVIEVSASLLLYFITKRISTDAYFPFVTAMLFALHPIHVEAVTWITSSMDMIGVVFMFLSLYLYIRVSELRTHRKRTLAFSLLSAFLAFSTNEVTLTLPGLLFIFDAYFLYPHDSWLQRIRRNIPYALVLSVYLFMRIAVAQEGARSGFLFNSPIVQFFVMCKAFLVYLQVLLLPAGLTINHYLGHGVTSWAVEIQRSSMITRQQLLTHQLFWLEAILTCSIVIASIFFAVKLRKKYRILSFSIAWFYVSFLTTLNIIPTEAIMVERFAYVPSFGFLLAVVWIFQRLFPLDIKKLKSRSGKIAWILLGCIIFVYAVLTFRRNSDWKNDDTLWKATLATNPRAQLVRLYVANEYLAQNNFEAGLFHYEMAYKYNPDYPEIQTTLGLLYQSKGENKRAIEILARQADQPVSALERYMLLANAYRQVGKYEQSVEAYKQALRLSTQDATIYNNIGAVYALLGQYDLAEESFKKALEIDPTSESAKVNLQNLQKAI